MIIRTYLCPDKWTAKGIWSRRISPTAVSVIRYDDLKLQRIRIGMAPSGSYLEQSASGSYQKIRHYMVPKGASELACTICRTRSQERGATVIDKLIALLNDYRSNFPDQTVISRDARLDAICKAYLYDMLNGTAYPTIRDYYQRYGFTDLATHTVLTVDVDKPLGQDPNYTSADAVSFVAKLIDQYPGIVQRREINLAGGFFLWFDSTWRGFRTMIALAEAEKLEHAPTFMDQPPATACDFRCVQSLEYYVHEYRKGVVFRVFVPDICQIWRVELTGDVKGPRWSTFCNRNESPFCYGQLTGNRSDLGIIPGRIFEVNTIGKEPVPGELFKVWAWMDGIGLDDCNPVLLAQSYYSHPCFTSGEIQEIMLVNEDESVEDSRTTGSTPDAWVGDTRLKYKISAEGSLLIVKPSDFFRYSCGERVFVHKGGTSTKREFLSHNTGAYGTLAGLPQDFTVAGCQDPHDASEFDIYS